MAVNKYLEFCVFNLVLCFSCLAITACAEIRQGENTFVAKNEFFYLCCPRICNNTSKDHPEKLNKCDKHLSDLDDNDDWWNKYQTTPDGNRNPWDWIDPPPRDDRFDYLIKKKNDNSVIYFSVFFAVLIFVLIVAFCGFLKYFCEMSHRNSRNTNYNRLAASDPRRSPSSQWSSVATISSNITHERRHFILEFSNPVHDSNYIVLDADPPPRYDEVVICDLSAEGNFPEVHSPIPDTPPPQYDENIPPRY